MELPKGWKSYDTNAQVENRPVKCSNCAWSGHENECEPHITDLRERVEPGDIMPVGECPAMLYHPNIGDYRCSALVYFDDVIIAFREKPGIIDEMIEATDAAD